MTEMGNEQFSALTDLLTFCRRAIRTRQVDVKKWQQLRSRMNSAFSRTGPPRIKAGYGLISDLMKGVPVTVVAERHKVSRGTVYRMIRDHPELAKTWEEKRKKEQQPDPAPAPMPDPTPVQPIKPPLPDVLLQFLGLHRPRYAHSALPAVLKRKALGVLLEQLGLVHPNEFASLTDEELIARVTAYQRQPGEARRDAAESAQSLDTASEARADDLSFWVRVGDVTDSLTGDEAAELIAGEITRNLDPFAGMGADHPFFAELPSHIMLVLTKLGVAGRQTINDDDIPAIARRAVGLVKDKGILPAGVLAFAGLAPEGAGGG